MTYRKVFHKKNISRSEPFKISKHQQAVLEEKADRKESSLGYITTRSLLCFLYNAHEQNSSPSITGP